MFEKLAESHLEHGLEENGDFNLNVTIKYSEIMKICPENQIGLALPRIYEVCIDAIVRAFIEDYLKEYVRDDGKLEMAKLMQTGFLHRVINAVAFIKSEIQNNEQNQKKENL